MPAQMDWKAEDEKAWGEFEPDIAPSPGGRRPKRRLALLLLALVIAVALAAVFVSRAGRLLDGSRLETEEEVLTGHALVVETAVRGDGDLLRELVFDRLQEWTDAQILLAQRGLWLDRAPLGLFVADGAAPMETTVTMEPALNQATVAMTVRYRVGLDEDGQETVGLTQTFAYRYHEERWLLNPPTGEFWGARETTSGRYLTLSYPERDADIGRRLAADLEAIIGQACHSVEMMNCLADLQLAVDLVDDPATLVALADPAWQLGGGQYITLPTPSVVGLPEDEAAYRALYRAYAKMIVARLISEQTDLAATGQPLLALSIMARILEQMGLQPTVDLPAAPPADGVAMALRLEQLWNDNGPLSDGLAGSDAQATRALIEFLASTWSKTPETEMLRSLARSGSVQEWLRRVGADTTAGTLVDAWEQAVRAANPEVAAQAWPDEVVLLMCDQGLIGFASLYQYDPAADVLSRVLSGREFIHMEQLPGGEGVRLTEQLLNQAGQRTYLWQDGQLTAYDGAEARAGAADLTRAQLARSARQAELAALSSDGRWLAVLDYGMLILSTTDEAQRRAVPQAGRDCRGLAWVQATSSESE